MNRKNDNKMKQVLFIDRDGTLIIEPPDEQIDTLKKLEFLPGVFKYLGLISQALPFELVIVSNQDGLGTEAYPQKDFDLVQEKILKGKKVPVHKKKKEGKEPKEAPKPKPEETPKPEEAKAEESKPQEAKAEEKPEAKEEPKAEEKAKEQTKT